MVVTESGPGFSTFPQEEESQGARTEETPTVLTGLMKASLSFRSMNEHHGDEFCKTSIWSPRRTDLMLIVLIVNFTGHYESNTVWPEMVSFLPLQVHPVCFYFPALRQLIGPLPTASRQVSILFFLLLGYNSLETLLIDDIG